MSFRLATSLLSRTRGVQSSLLRQTVAQNSTRLFKTVPTTLSSRAYSISTSDLEGSKAHKKQSEWGKFFGSVLFLSVVAGGAIYYVRFVDNDDVALPLIPALDPKNFVKFNLSEIIEVSPNSKIFRFDIPEDADILGLPVASCVVAKLQNGFKDEEKTKPSFVFRPYTPLETEELVKAKKFDLLVKHYEKGAMSSLIFGLKPGDHIELKGPIIKHLYKPNEFKNITLIAGGTGITPSLQVIRAVLNNTEVDKTNVHLVFCNLTEKDILLKKELDEYAAKYPEQFKIDYFVDKPSWLWKGQKGYVTSKFLKSILPEGEGNKIFVCGPPPMMDAISGNKAKDYTQGPLSGALKELGYSEKDVFKF